MSYPAPANITTIDAGSPAVSSAAILDSNYTELTTADAALAVAFASFFNAWAPKGGLFVSNSSPSDLPIAGTGLTIQLVTGSVWLINGFTIEIGGSNVVIAGIPDNKPSGVYVYLTLDDNGVPIFDSATDTPTPQTGKPCAAKVATGAGSVSSIDTSATDRFKTYAYLNSGTGGGGGGDDDSDLQSQISGLDSRITTLETNANSATMNAAPLDYDTMPEEVMGLREDLAIIDPASGRDTQVSLELWGLTGNGENGTEPDNRSGGDGSFDPLTHGVF